VNNNKTVGAGSKKSLSAREISVESLLVLIAYAKEEARRLGMSDTVQLLELPELSVLQAMTGFEMSQIDSVSTAVEAVAVTLEKSN